MKLLFDQNLARVLVRRLTAEYPESADVAELGLATATDRAIWEFARSNDYVTCRRTPTSVKGQEGLPVGGQWFCPLVTES